MSRLSVLLALGLCLTTVPASAGVRVWEKNADNPDTLQFFDVGGFVQPGFVWRGRDTLIQQNSINNDTGFYLQRARVNFKAQFTKYLLASFEFDGTGPALNDAYVQSAIAPYFQLRAGQFLVPFLQTFQFNEVNTSFNDRQIYIPQDYSRDFLRYVKPRDVGFMISGVVGNVTTTATAPVFEYQAGLFNGGGQGQASNPDRAFLYAARLQLHVFGLPTNRAAESDLVRNVAPKVAVGLGGMMNCDDRANWNRGFTGDVEFRFAGIYASASYVWFKNGPADGFGKAMGYGYYCKGGQIPEHIANGAHLQAQYALPSAWFGPLGTVELLGRYDNVDPFSSPVGFFGSGPGTEGYVVPPRYDDSDNAPARWRLTFGANWYPMQTQNLRLSLNYQFSNQSEPLEVGSDEVQLQKNLLWIQLTAGI